MLGFVDQLKQIKEELEKDGSVSEVVKLLKSMLSEGADFSTLYDDVKNGIGSNYMDDFYLKTIDPQDKKQFGSVLVLIPYICDISEEAVIKMKELFSRAIKERRQKTETNVDNEEQERSTIVVQNPKQEYPSKVDILTEEVKKLHRKVDEKFDQMGRQIQQVEGKVDDLDSKVTDIQASMKGTSRQHLPPQAEAGSFPGALVNKPPTDLAECHSYDFSTIYDMTLDKGLDYLKDLRLQGVDASDIRNFGSVLVLIPYLCDRSEEAIGVMTRRPLPPLSQDASSDSEEQNDDVSDDQWAGSEYTVGAGVSDGVSQLQLIQIQNQQAMAVMLKELKELNSKMDRVDKTVKQQAKLIQQTEDIKGRLTSVFSQLEEIRKALELRSETTTALELDNTVSTLQERIRKLLVQNIDTTTLGEIKDIESEVVKLLQQFKGVNDNVKTSLTQMNRHLQQLKGMLLTLTVESLYQPQLSDTIEMVTKEFGSKDCTRFARKLDPEIDTTLCVPPGHLVPQMPELLQLWRDKNGSSATLEVLEQACRKSGLPELADKISRIPGASSSVEFPPISRARRSVHDLTGLETYTRDSEALKMDPAHRDILRKHREFIVRDLNVDRVKGSLIQNEVFRTGDWDYIAAAGRGTRYDKASELMDELPTRGPNAFWCFCEALMIEGYAFLGNPLIEEAKQLPQKVPTQLLAIFLKGKVTSIREEYRMRITSRGVSVMKALKKVGYAKKTGGRTGSEQRAVFPNYICTIKGAESSTDEDVERDLPEQSRSIGAKGGSIVVKDDNTLLSMTIHHGSLRKEKTIRIRLRQSPKSFTMLQKSTQDVAFSFACEIECKPSNLQFHHPVDVTAFITAVPEDDTFLLFGQEVSTLGTKTWRDVSKLCLLERSYSRVSFKLNHFSKYDLVAIGSSIILTLGIKVLLEYLNDKSFPCSFTPYLGAVSRGKYPVTIVCKEGYNVSTSTPSTYRRFGQVRTSEFNLLDEEKLTVTIRHDDLVGECSESYQINRATCDTEEGQAMDLLVKPRTGQGLQAGQVVVSVCRGNEMKKVCFIPLGDQSPAISSPTEEPLSSSQVPRQEQNRPVVRDLFIYIKRKVGMKWKDLAFFLDFDGAEIETIDDRNRDCESRCMDMLEQWHGRQGAFATIEILLRALSKAGIQDVVDGLEIKFPGIAEFKDAGKRVKTDARPKLEGIAEFKDAGKRVKTDARPKSEEQQKTGQNGPMMMMSQDARGHGYSSDVYHASPVLTENLAGRGWTNPNVAAICAIPEDDSGESVVSGSRPPSRATISSGFESTTWAESQRYVTEKQHKETQQELVCLREKADDMDRSVKGLHDKVDSLMRKSRKDKNLILGEFQELHKEHRKLEGSGDINTALKHVEYTIETKCDGRNVEAIRDVKSVVRNLSAELQQNLSASQISAHQFYEALCDKLIVQIIGNNNMKDIGQRVESPKIGGQSLTSGKPRGSEPRSHSVGSGNSRDKQQGEKHIPTAAAYKKKERVTIV
uniref:Death domain-containing protein n=1 Tax=Branchiostoma floridae TaxID=7739 RepID=C3XSQ3_BRAFL|eukprot:XP_002612965.1 hypothetical protein BRAFLDRAFT_74750 [Branchiostoma floridae]